MLTLWLTQELPWRDRGLFERRHYCGKLIGHVHPCFEILRHRAEACAKTGTVAWATFIAARIGDFRPRTPPLPYLVCFICGPAPYTADK